MNSVSAPHRCGLTPWCALIFKLQSRWHTKHYSVYKYSRISWVPFPLIDWALHNSMHALRLRSHSTAVQLQSTGFRETKNDRRAYLSLRIVCNSRTWSFILIILRLGPNSAGFCHRGGFSSGMSLRPFVNSQSSAAVKHLSDVSEASVVFCVPFCSLTFTRSGIIWKTELIHPHKQENITFPSVPTLPQSYRKSPSHDAKRQVSRQNVPLCTRTTTTSTTTFNFYWHFHE